MCRILQHRGPDGEGIWTSSGGQACLGHRRLSIIDLATGGQPMLDAAGRRAITFNGEIYNFVELREELESRGRSFRTRSDTEVLLAAFDEWGLAALQKAVGMFAFALWDESDRSLLLARDRIGKKPLFYLRQGDRLWFASSLEAIRAGANASLSIDPRAVDLFLSLGYIPAPFTIYREVAKLEAGTCLTFRNGESSIDTYWDPARPRQSFQGTMEEADEAVDRLVHDAVRIRLRSDVPDGVFLSGGIDSSLVAAIAARERRDRVKTFTMTFEEKDFDESAHAAEVARRLGTEHHAFLGSRAMLELLPEYLRHFGEPFGDSSAFNVWRLSEGTRRHVTVALGGDGGDEAFAGYDWYRTALRLRRIAAGLPTPLLRGLHATIGMLGSITSAPGLARVARGLGHLSCAGDAERFASLRTFIGDEEVAHLYGPVLKELRGGRVSPAAMLLVRQFEGAGGSLLRRLRYTDIRTYLADCLMPKVDVAAMAHGLEVRAPLLDHRIIELALDLPDEWLLDRSRGKLMMRRLVGRYLPPGLFDRHKQGFSIPLKHWFKGPPTPQLDIVGCAALFDSGLIRREGVARLLRSHALGHRDHSQRLFNLLVLGRWLEAIP